MKISCLDRTLRVLLGIGLVYMGFIRKSGTDALNASDIILGLVGLAIAVAAILKICPTYIMKNNSACDDVGKSHSSRQEATIQAKSNQTLIRKLQLSIVIPTAIVIISFSILIYDLNHELDMQKLTKKAEVASLVIESDLISTENSATIAATDRSNNTDEWILEEAIATTELFVHHNSEGQLLPLSLKKGHDNKTLMSAVLSRATAPEFDDNQTISHMFSIEDKSYILLSIPVQDSNSRLTSITESPPSHGFLNLLMSNQFLVNVLLVLLMGLWTSSYIIQSFIYKVNEDENLLRYQATHDILTQLPNRNLINNIVSEKIANGNSNTSSVALCMVDVVGFREINDTLGNAFGDALLVKLSERFKSIEPRITDVVRMGADVFCLICSIDTDLDRIQDIANKVHNRMEAKQELNGIPIVVQARIGISIFPADSTNPEELVRLANIALAQAKKQSSATCFYENEFNTHSVRKLALLAKLSSAIETDELTLVYQPKLDLHRSQIVGVEVLVRWYDEEYGHISPVEFVRWAEKSGLIDNLTHWVLRTAEKQCAAWQAQGCNLPFAINLSPTNLYDQQLVPLVANLMKSGSFSAGLLELELTEDAVMVDPDKAMDTMNLLSDLGITFAIDDFGTGHSSFAYLQKFPVKNLKIDRAFIKNIDQSDQDAVLAHSMINLGHELGCVVTGEGVEDAQSLEKLRTFGCDHIQGYYISKPLTADEFICWYNKGQYIPELAA